MARLPLDTFIGVKTHRLNELWSLGPIKFSDWLQRAGRRYTRGAYGVHISDTRCHNKIKDTFLCFSGPYGMIPPWSRGVKFKLIDITDVEKLSTPGESAQERIVRLLKRDLERRSTGEKQDITAMQPPAGDGSSDGSSGMDV